MVLENYVKLTPGVPKRLHFTDHALVTKTLTDPLLGRSKEVRSLEFLVDSEDGVKVDKSFSVVSEKLAATLEPWLGGKRYLAYEFVITKRGESFVTSYTVDVTPARA